MRETKDLEKRIKVGIAAVLAQTERLHRDLGRVGSLWKKDGTRVTEVDLAISSALHGEIEAAFPEDQFFSEELAHAGAPIPLRSVFAWVLDPVDGTNNYAAGLPFCAISLALLHEGRPVYGIIYDLARRCLVHGGPGFGVWDGARHLLVMRSPAEPKHALIGFHTPSEKCYAAQARLLIENYKIRALGSSTLHLTYVATGHLEGVVDHNVKLWDIAAAVPLVWALGGETRFLQIDPFPMRRFDLEMPRLVYVAGSSSICSALLETLNGP